MKWVVSAAVALFAFASMGAANATAVNPVFINAGVNSTTAQSTTLFRADLTGLGLTQIGAIEITDSNSGVGGSPGAYSGFDLDAIFLDVDGDASTLGDQYYASSFLFSGGTLRPDPGGTFGSNTAGPLNGSASLASVDEGFATLNAIDAIFFSTGSISLGDGGMLTALFAPELLLGPSLYLFIGEVGTQAGEAVNAMIEVRDVSTIPLPPAILLLLSALGMGGVLGMRRKAA